MSTTRIEVLRAGPNDIIVFKTEQYLSDDQHQRLIDNAEPHLHGRKAMVLSSGIDMQVLRAEEAKRLSFRARLQARRGKV